MTVKEIMEREQRHAAEGASLESLYTVELFLAGKFYHAYEWSAWLLVRYAEKLKVRRENFSEVGADLCFVGFPTSSLPKFTPQGAMVSDADSQGTVRIVMAPSIQQQNTDAEAMRLDYQSWRGNIAITQRQHAAAPAHAREREPECIFRPGNLQDQVLAFPVEHRTPIECQSFLSALRQEIVRRRLRHDDDGKEQTPPPPTHK